MKKRNELLGRFEDRMGLTSRQERIWFWCGFALLLVYVEAVVLFQNVYVGSTSPIFLGLSALAAVPACFAGVSLCKKMRITPAVRSTCAKSSRLVAAGGFLLTLAIMLIAQLAFFPGSFGNDNLVQLEQVYSGNYSNWHPVLHTWLFFTLPLKLVPQHWFIVTCQLIWYSLAMGYLLYVLSTSGSPRWLLVITWFLIVCNPNSIDLMLYPLKDSAMTIFCIVLFAYLVRIYLSRGQWLKKPLHLLLFALFAFLTMGMRHNAVLLIAPIFLFLLIFFPSVRHQTCISTSVLLSLFLLWHNAVLPLANVEIPGQRPVELVGLPMTILCDIYAEAPDTMPEDVRNFMSTLAPEEAWPRYSSGNFNSIKWADSDLTDKVNAQGIGTILSYTFQSAVRTPKTALKAFVNLTHMVWGYDDTRGFTMGEAIGANSLGIQSQYNPTLKFFFTSWRQACNQGILKYAFTLLGPTIALLLFLAVSQLGGGNLPAVFLVLAPMCHHFGTMLLLSGQDYRFFHMHFVSLIPIIYIILTNKRCIHGE